MKKIFIFIPLLAIITACSSGNDEIKNPNISSDEYQNVNWGDRPPLYGSQDGVSVPVDYPPPPSFTPAELHDQQRATFANNYPPSYDLVTSSGYCISTKNFPIYTSDPVNTVYASDAINIDDLSVTEKNNSTATVSFWGAYEVFPSERKDKIIEDIRDSGVKTLVININGLPTYDNNIDDMVKLLKEVSITHLRIGVYREPKNILEILDNITWNKSSDMRLSLEFHNLSLPYELRIYDYIDTIDQMIKRNNGDTPLASVRIVFDPLFAGFDSPDRILYETGSEILQKLNTKSLTIDGLSLAWAGSEYPLDWRNILRDFLEKSPIPTIDIHNIVEKNDGKIEFFN